jgi:hypothetical protein
LKVLYNELCRKCYDNWPEKIEQYMPLFWSQKGGIILLPCGRPGLLGPPISMQNPPSWVRSYIPDSSEMSAFRQKTTLTPQHGLVSKSLDPRWHVTCWVTDMHFNACRDGTDIQFHTLFLLPFCCHLIFVFHIHLLHYPLFASSCLFFLISFFFLPFMPQLFFMYFFPNFFRYSLSFVVCYLFSSTSLYFLLIFFHLFLYIYPSIISFFLSSDALFLPSFINLLKPTDYLTHQQV